MAYDPAELKLPSWLLKLLNALIGLHLPVAPGWQLGVTRPGVIFVAALLGVWAAAFYSSNNLLYLCGAMMLALMAAAVAQAVLLLRQFPGLQDTLPLLEAGQATALRQPLPAVDRTEFSPDVQNTAAVVDVSWRQGDHKFALVWRSVGRRMHLSGALHSYCRGVFHTAALQLHTSAPLGLFVLACQRHDPFDMIVLPALLPWDGGAGGLPVASGFDADGERGDEGDQWRDLRAYAPGDALARVHWRKAVSGTGWSSVSAAGRKLQNRNCCGWICACRPAWMRRRLNSCWGGHTAGRVYMQGSLLRWCWARPHSNWQNRNSIN